MQVAETASLLEQGIRAAVAGNRPLAKLHLEEAVKGDAQNAELWLWLAWVADSPEQAESCLQWVKYLDPAHPLAGIGLQWARAMRDAARYALGHEPAASASLLLADDSSFVAATDEPVDEVAVNPLWQLTPESEVVTSELVDLSKSSHPSSQEFEDEIDERLAAAQRLVEESIEHVDALEAHPEAVAEVVDFELNVDAAEVERDAELAEQLEADAKITESLVEDAELTSLNTELEALAVSYESEECVEPSFVPGASSVPLATETGDINAPAIETTPVCEGPLEPVDLIDDPIISDDEMRALICLDDIEEDITLIGTDGSDFELATGPVVTQLVFLFEEPVVAETTNTEPHELRRVGPARTASVNELV